MAANTPRATPGGETSPSERATPGEGEQRYQRLFELSPDAVVVARAGSIVLANPAAARLLRVADPAALLGRSIIDLVAPEDRERIGATYERLKAGEPVAVGRWRVRRDDGSMVDVESSSVPVELEGSPAVQTIVRDITEQKRNQSLLEIQRDLGVALATANSVPEALQTAVEALVRVEGIDCCGAYVTDDRGGLSLLAQSGLSAEFAAAVSTFAPDSPEARVTMAAAPIHSWDYPDADAMERLRAREGLRVLVAFPMVVDGRVVASLHAASRTLGSFPSSLVAAVDAIRSQATGALSRILATVSLREGERRYRTIVENMTDVVYAVDERGTVTYMSPSCERAMGYRPEEVVGRPFVDFVAPGDLPAVEAGFRGLLSLHPEAPIEFRVIDAAGAIHRVRSAGSSARGPDGRVFVSGVLADVTDRWRAEEAARRERELLERVADTSPIGIVVLDAAGTIQFANVHAEGLLGLSASQMAGRSYNAPEWRVTAVDGGPFADTDLPVARVVTTRRPVYGIEHAIEWPSGGRRVLLSINAAPIFDDTGRVVSIVTAIEDVTRRKSAEAELRASEQRFAGAFRSSPAPMSITRVSDARVIDTNDAMLDLLGYTREESIGLTVNDLGLWVDPTTGDIHRRMLAAAGRVRDHEVQMVAREGRILTVRYSAEPVELGGERCILSALMDVTERRAAEEALRGTERRLRQLIDSAPFGAHVYDLQADGRLVFAGANESANRILGVDHRQFVGRTIEEAFPPLAQTLIPDAYRRVARDGEAYHDDQVSYESRDIAGVFDVHGLQLAPGRMAAFFQDVTERRRAEHAVAVITGRLRALVDGVPLPIVGLASDMNVVSWNAGAERVFGWTADEVIGMPYPIVPAELSDETQQRFRLSLAGQPTAGRDTKRTRRDGSSVDVRVWSAAWPQVGGEPQGLFAIIEDITKERQAAAALERSSREIEELFNRAPVGYHSLDGDGRFVRMNDTELAWLGYAREEVIGKLRFPDLLSAADARAFEVNFARFKAEGAVRDIEYELTRRDGSRLPVLLSSRAVLDAEGRFLMTNSTIWDATERKVAEAEREALEAQLRQAQKMEAIGKLAGGVAHDFNNLLTAIAGYADLVRSTFTPEDARLEDIDEIRRASDTAAGLVRQLLAFSRQQVLQPEVMDLGDAVRDVERMLRRLLGADVTLVTKIDPGLDLVLADHSHMVQVVLNLAVNARDAMPEGGTLTIEVANEVLHRAFAETHPSVIPGRHVRLTVIDTGIGMDDEALRHLFEPFFTTKELGKGTGLGLATVYGIVKQSGGSVWAESAVGAGSRFTVYVPSHAGLKADRRDVLAPAPTTRLTGTVLVVEDAPAVLRYVDTVLRQRGHRVFAARHGAHALEVVHRHAGAIDVLLTDVVMPNMSGREVADRVRALIPGLPVVYMSGNATTVLSDESLAAGEAVLLPKPFTPDELDAVIQDALRRSR
jgi:two-component system cell cycle sensor histidine kinase/response regulator CckA